MKYLHQRSPGIYHLDHRLLPEVRAMLAAMSSRMPKGGIRARYAEIVEVVAEDIVRNTMEWAGRDPGSMVVNDVARSRAEDRLCEYPLHPKVQGFFDKFVGQYGHSSIQEQVGDPAIYIEGISWMTAWLLFDSPLCRGQEFSTRAVRHKDWPVALEAGDDLRFEALHNDWMTVFMAEVEWWKEHFKSPENRKAAGVADKEPFRPALDRARWALPGTISSGLCFTSDIRERARVIKAGKHLGEPEQPVWTAISEAYKKALPGIAPHALRERQSDKNVPAHLRNLMSPAPRIERPTSSQGVQVMPSPSLNPLPLTPYERERRSTYMDPWKNREGRIALYIECSLAVARDWHRHRTLYPWTLNTVLDEAGNLQIASDYAPMSDLARERAPALWANSTALWKSFMGRGDIQKAALCLPFGTKVAISGQGGVRDVIYTLELRAYTHGANFEYKRQAEAALRLLGVQDK